MYKEFYRLRERPFSITSDPNFLFFSRTHREAMSHMLFGIRERKGFIAITGEIGTGKTTLCKAVLNELGEAARTAYIFNPSLSGVQLMENILEDFGVAPVRRNKGAMFKQLNLFLIEELSAERNVILIIDEAQNLKQSLFEQIRMLSNLETEKEKLLQIVFVGQPQLTARLNSPALTQLKQRIAVRYHLAPLDRDEIGQYIYHRLKVAGSSDNIIFTPEALEVIATYSSGLPRVINIVSDRCLLHGYVKGTMHIDDDIVLKSISEIEGVEYRANVAVAQR
ncbi:MAG: AAA family ATPase [Candidatus Omnitrophota bacterium]